MTVDADIGNMALSHLGTRATIASLTESSTEARVLNLWYEKVRDHVQSTVDWNFNRVYAALSSSGTPPDRWGYSYAYPSDCLKFWRIDTGISMFPIDPAVKFEVGSNGTDRFIWTNYAQAVGVYGQRVTSPNRFEPQFITAFAVCLAAAIAYPITQKSDIASALKAEAKDLLERAMCESANEQLNNEADRVAESISTRGYDNLSWLNTLGLVTF